MTKYYGFLKRDALAKRGIDYGCFRSRDFNPEKYNFNEDELRLFPFGPGLGTNAEFMRLWNDQDYVSIVVRSRG